MKQARQLTARAEDLRWFREARFGMFVHWAPVCLVGKEIGWSRGGWRADLGDKGKVPLRIYDNLYKRFNPVRFDARRWVEVFQAAGMKYLVFTTKHHDGFCMFDSHLTDYTIMQSPFGRDITGELAAACHEAGVPIGFYYSQIDWRHPDYRTDSHQRYIRYLHGQIEELCTRYGKVALFWFDGGGSVLDWDGVNLVKMMRRLQPGVLINRRLGVGGDFGTPEQQIGAFQTDPPWESCITLCRQWSWRPNDELKSLKECVQTLVRCAGGDGNLLLNVAPMPDGRIEPRQVVRLRQIGQWLEKNGQTIYGTRGGPFPPRSSRACTHRGRTAYLHLIARKRRAKLVLQQIPEKILSSRVLVGGPVNIRQMAGGVEVTMGPGRPHPIDTIVEIELDRPVTIETGDSSVEA